MQILTNKMRCHLIPVRIVLPYFKAYGISNKKMGFTI